MILKTLNGDSELTTFDIFSAIDEKTRKCAFEFGSGSFPNDHGARDYTGTFGTFRQGVGFYESELATSYITLDILSQGNGFLII